MMKSDFKDLTFIIPIRLDSIYRFENLIMSVSFLQSNFQCEIIIIEADSFNNTLIENQFKNVNYIFIEDHDPIFYRTKYLNTATLKSKTPYIAIWDSDIIINQLQMNKALDYLRDNKAEMVYPYDGRMLDTTFILRKHYFKTRDINFLTRHMDKMNIIDYYSYGGAIFVKKESYLLSGMENENFYGWGPEDLERYQRWKNMNYRIVRVEGVLYHLTHSRGVNSKSRSNNHMKICRDEAMKSIYSSKTDIVENVKNGYYKK